MGLRRAFPLLGAISLPDILPVEADIFGVFLEAVGGSLESLEAGILGHDLGGPNHDGQCPDFSYTIRSKFYS